MAQGASKYGKQFGEGTIALFHGTGKSGLTPIELVDPSISSTIPIQQKAREHEDYQRRYLRGFTSRELQDADSLEIEALPLGNLSGMPIHAALKRSQWTESDFKIGGGIEGVWGGKNDKVELWFDALLNGPRKKIDFSKVNDQGPVIDLYTFERRNPEQASGNKAISKIFGKFDIKFLFQDGSTNAPGNQGKVNGSHRSLFRNQGKGDYAGSCIFLNCENSTPLLRKDLSSSQRIAQQFNIAQCLLHELAHAAGKCVDTLEKTICGKRKREEPEPFFEDEEINELGYVLENWIWGGTLDPVYIKQDRPGPRLALYRTNVRISFKHFKDGRQKPNPSKLRYRYHERFQFGGSNSTATYSLVEITFMWKLQMNAFWDSQIRRLGTEALKPRSIYEHVYSVQQNKSTSPYIVACGKDYLDWWKEKPSRPRLFPAAHDDVEMAGVEQEAKHSAMMNALEQNANGKRQRAEGEDDSSNQPPSKQQRLEPAQTGSGSDEDLKQSS
ncbi:hypothetical protein N431DRAFT_467304 [Stipitochalara longipes BDJ]|nr:hypothetical protein N431DRAFT_467304 [Stipitochalara longipes BDJ]